MATKPLLFFLLPPRTTRIKSKKKSLTLRHPGSHLGWTWRGASAGSPHHPALEKVRHRATRGGRRLRVARCSESGAATVRSGGDLAPAPAKEHDYKAPENQPGAQGEQARSPDPGLGRVEA